MAPHPHPRLAFLHPSDEPGGGLLLSVPSLRGAVRHLAPVLLEGVIGPVVIFYLSLVFAGFTGALFCAFGWSVAVVVRRLICRQKVPGTVWLSLLLLAGRTAVGVITKSAALYFLQPTLSTVLVGLAFLASAAAKRPFIEHLAQDFCPLPPELLARPAMRRFFTRISLIWATVMLANAGIVIALLVTSSLRAFVVERSLVTWGLSGAAIAISVVAFARVLSGEGIRVRFGRARA